MTPGATQSASQRQRGRRWQRLAPALLASLLLLLLLLPMLGLVLSLSTDALSAGLTDPRLLPALSLSARTSLLSLCVIVLCGTPLAYWLARGPRAITAWVGLLIDLPIVVPPAVIGIALLLSFGRGGVLAPLWAALGWSAPFTSIAVVLAQVVVAAPFYIQGAAAAFRRVDPNLLLVARTLGATPTAAALRVALPLALPGLLAGAALSWARALGEFGATLIFAGNLPGRTQTMPLAIYVSLESSIDTAIALSLLLLCCAVVVLSWLRWLSQRDGPRGVP